MGAGEVNQNARILHAVSPSGLSTRSTLPTLRAVLHLPAFRGSSLLTGDSHLDQPVTWVHAAEILEIWRFLSGGEVLLTTGLELARVSATSRANYLRSLAKAGVRALGVELVMWMRRLPQEMLETAREINFPVFVLTHEVSFAELTRAAHQLILRPAANRTAHHGLQSIVDALIETGRAQSFLANQLGPLLSLPQRPRTTLLTTLEMLLDTEFNITEAARRLGVRRQSIYYRMEQLIGLLGSLDDNERRLGYSVAFALMRRREEKGEKR